MFPAIMPFSLLIVLDCWAIGSISKKPHFLIQGDCVTAPKMQEVGLVLSFLRKPDALANLPIREECIHHPNFSRICLLLTY
jgi:hypothetical protein